MSMIERINNMAAECDSIAVPFVLVLDAQDADPVGVDVWPLPQHLHEVGHLVLVLGPAQILLPPAPVAAGGVEAADDGPEPSGLAFDGLGVLLLGTGETGLTVRANTVFP